MKIYLLAAIALLIIAPLALMNAHAKDKETTQEQKLEAIFTKMISSQKDNLEKQGIALQLTGDLNIEKATNYYAVTLPEMTVTDNTGNNTDIGMIAINVTPTSKENIWKMAAALPTPISTKNKQGIPISRIDIGNQKFNGIYNSEINSFTELMMEYKNVKATDLKDDVVMNMQGIQFTSDFDVKDGLMSGPSDMRINNISIGNANTPNKVTIESVNIEGEYNDINPLALTQNIQNFKISDLGGAKLKGEIKNLASALNISSVKFEVEGEKEKNGLSDQKLSIKYDGLEKGTNSKISIPFVPNSMDIEIDFNKLPVSDLYQIGKMRIESQENQAPAASVNMLQALTSIPKKMASAGSNLDIKSFDFNNEYYEIKTRGNLEASDVSPMMVIGDITMSAKNVDTFKKAINTRIKSVSRSEHKALNSILQQINFIETNCEGKKGDYDCILNFSKEGQISLNGNPLSVMDMMRIAQ